MKNMKKLFALVLALALCFSLGMTAMAATPDPGPHTLTIKGTHTGHTYEAYQIFKGDLDTDGVLSNVDWGTGVDGAAILTALKADEVFGVGAANEFSACDNGEEVAQVLTHWSPDSAKLDHFAEVVEDHLTGVFEDSTEGTGMVYTITDLESGYYLIKDKDNTITGKDDYYTKLMIRIVKSSTATPKGDVPQVDKSVNNQLGGTYGAYIDQHIGVPVYYKLTGTLPSQYAAYEWYTYEFNDTMTAGLDYTKIERVYVAGADDAEKYVISDTAYTVNVNEIVNALGVKTETKLTITFANLKAALPDLVPSDKIVVKYSAKLNSNAVIGSTGNPNEVTLKYSNNPNNNSNWGITPPSDPVVYTFGLEILKIDGVDTSKVLPGAEFVLYHNHNTGSGTEKKYAKVVDGKLTGWVDLADATKLTTGPDGKITVKGLDAGYYYLTETKAPTGYNKLDTDVQVVIIAGYTGTTLTTLTSEVDGMPGTGNVDSGMVGVSVRNNAGTTLPSTGGVGTTMFYIVGGILVAAAVVLLVTRRRMSEEQ